MRKVILLFIGGILNLSGMHIIRALPRKPFRNTQVCFNNVPRNFGSTHFIVGYTDNSRVNKKLKKNKNKPYVIQNNDTPLIDKNRISQSFFTTIHDLSPILLEIMAEAKRYLYIAAFTLTDRRIVDYVKDAYAKGIEVCIITDASNVRQAHSKVNMLLECNIPVWYYKPTMNPNYKKNGLSEPFMHHKIIVGDDFVVTGSANFTKAGQKTNIENINILRDKQTVEEHRLEFERLKKFCVQCTSQINA